MKAWLFLVMCATLPVGQGCGSGFSATGGGGSSTTSGGTGGSSTSGAGGGGGGGAAACPNVLGAYTVTDVGMGCNGLNLAAPECIRETSTPCQVLLVSKDSAGGRGVDGIVGLDASGDFTNGMVKLGGNQRSGCTGTWNPKAGQMTVNCGGMGSGQSCTATMTRTGKVCGF